MGENLNIDNQYNSCWYNKLQFVLFLLAFFAFGIGDTISSIHLIEHKGIMGEGNLIVRYLILNYGISNFIAIKISVSLLILFLPFLLINKTVYWMMSGFLISFIFAGTLGTVLNIQAAMNGVPYLSPEQAIVIFMLLVLILTNIGDEIDKRVQLKIRPYFECFLKDIAIFISHNDKNVSNEQEKDN